MLRIRRLVIKIGCDRNERTLDTMCRVKKSVTTSGSRSGRLIREYKKVGKVTRSSLTCSGFSPGGTHVNSSSGQPLSSSEVEFRFTL